MRTLLLYSLIIILTVQKCPQDDEDNSPYSTEQVPDAERNLIIDSIMKEWNQFRAESKKQLVTAKNEIREAMDRLEVTDTRNKLLLEMEIIKAESILEQLNEKFYRGERFDNIEIGQKETVKMNHYRTEYKKKEERLKKVLLSLKSEYYKK